MPAAAVIPAPIAYIKVVAVKKLVVEDWGLDGGRPCGLTDSASLGRARAGRCSSSGGLVGRVTVKKLECLKQAG